MPVITDLFHSVKVYLSARKIHAPLAARIKSAGGTTRITSNAVIVTLPIGASEVIAAVEAVPCKTHLVSLTDPTPLMFASAWTDSLVRYGLEYLPTVRDYSTDFADACASALRDFDAERAERNLPRIMAILAERERQAAECERVKRLEAAAPALADALREIERGFDNYGMAFAPQAAELARTALATL